MLAKDIMTQNVITITAKEPISKAVELMLQYDISGLPVVDGENCLCGVLSESDLILGGIEPQVPHRLLDALVKRLAHTTDMDADYEALNEEIEEAARSTVSEYMTTTVRSVTVQSSIQAVAALINTFDINRVPVVDEQNHLVGIISRRDLLREMYRQSK